MCSDFLPNRTFTIRIREYLVLHSVEKKILTEITNNIIPVQPRKSGSFPKKDTQPTFSATG